MANAKPSGSDPPEECQPLDPSDEVRITGQMRTLHYPGRGPIMNQYERRQRIGRGQHGEVHVGVDLNTGSWVAIKGMNRKNAKEDKMKMLKKNPIQPSPHTPITDRLGSTENKIRKEIAIMKKCRHAHIVRLLEVIDDRMKSKIYMIMEYLGGGEIKWRNTSSEPILHVDQARRICRDAILGLEYLHYQGIIHRDIKPANLLWTEDRQMVKITDFGVSHFSLALRAAAAGSGAALDDTCDPRLLDDSELSKMAGTPSFLAPEVVHEFTDEATPSISNSNSNNFLSTCKSVTKRSNSTINVSASKSRPPITKAIDVWALGATLYCLLFGRIPFHHSGDNAYRLYIHIANSDWDVAETMGFDRIPTGGRHHSAEDSSEGAIVVNILDGMLQKNAQDRSTLDVVKSNPWITRDIQNPAGWLRETSPSKNDMVMVTDSETASAMSSLKYRHGWPKRVKQRLSTMLHNVRAHRSSRSIGHHVDADKFGTSSAPHLHFGSPKSSRAKGRTSESVQKGKKVDHRETEKGKGVDPREKGKGRSKGRPSTARNESTPDITATSARSKSIDRWPLSRENNSAMVPSGRSHRGSASLLTPGDSDVDPSSPTSSRAGEEHMYSRRSGDERPRNRFSLASLKHWRPHKHSSHGSTPLAASTSTLSSSVEPYTPPPSSATPSKENQARSDVILGYFGDRNSPLIFARRASSWGEASDYFEDVLSLNSGDEFLEDDAIMLGAGGVSNEPPYGSSTPIGLTTAAEAASADSLRLRQPQLEGLIIRSANNSPMHDTSLSRQSQIRSQTASPLAQVMYGSGLDIRNMPYDGGSDDDSLSYGEVIEDGRYQGAYPDVESIRSSQVFEDDDDEEDSDEEIVPIEVKRRRPSVAITVASPTPPSERGSSN